MAEAHWDCFKWQRETGFLSVSHAGPRDILCTCQLKTIYICFSHSSSQRGKWTFLSAEALESVTNQDKATSARKNEHRSERRVWCWDLFVFKSTIFTCYICIVFLQYRFMKCCVCFYLFQVICCTRLIYFRVMRSIFQMITNVISAHSWFIFKSFSLLLFQACFIHLFF